MRKRIVAALLVGVMVLGAVGCGKSSDDATKKAKTEEASKEEVVDLNEEIEVTLPAFYAGDEMTQEDVDKEVEDEGFVSGTLNEDGSVTYVMTREKRDALVEETKKEIDEAIEETIGADDTPDITAIEHNDAYTEYTIKTNNTELSDDEGFLAYGIYMYGKIMAMLSDDKDTKVYVSFVNAESGEVIDDSDTSDYDLENLLKELENLDFGDEGDVGDVGDTE